VRIGAGVSTVEDSVAATTTATRQARGSLGEATVDLALVFASPHHADQAEALLAAVHKEAAPAGLIGCVGESVVSGPREIEAEPAVSVWLGSLPGGAETFHMQFAQTASGGVFAGWRSESGENAAGTLLLICDPFTFPADLLLQHFNEAAPGLSVVGGMASGAGQPGATVLFQDQSVVRDGAVGAKLPAAVVRTLVSQGCRPVGQSYVVTKADRNLLLELGGQPPLERLRETLNGLAQPDRELVAQGLHVGRVIDEYRSEFGIGDFLVRGVMGAVQRTGAIAVGDQLQVGQTVQFHIRDAATADEELRSLLERTAGDLPGRPAGALLFTCNGRGSRMFSTPHHDAALVDSFLRVPMAGFFCAGEFGPVGGKNFLHGFTASLAVFVDERRPSQPS
jgi:small ligand-binding sensory domain FIST